MSRFKCVAEQATECDEWPKVGDLLHNFLCSRSDQMLARGGSSDNAQSIIELLMRLGPGEHQITDPKLSDSGSASNSRGREKHTVDERHVSEHSSQMNPSTPDPRIRNPPSAAMREQRT